MEIWEDEEQHSSSPSLPSESSGAYLAPTRRPPVFMSCVSLGVFYYKWPGGRVVVHPFCGVATLSCVRDRVI